MTKKIKKSLLIASLVVSSFLTCGAVYSSNVVNANAETATVQNVDFGTVFGAAVRLTEPNGIRFKLQLSESKKTEVFGESSDKTLGMFIFPGSKLETVTDYSTLSQKIDIEFKENNLYKVGDYWYANGVMTNLYIQNFNKEFVGVGYIYDGTNYEYTQVNKADNVRSMSYVVNEAYVDSEYVEYKDTFAGLIEKSVYAESGVTEKREQGDNDTITYTFTKGENTWSSYEEMKTAMPISMTVATNQTELVVGESLDLGAALVVDNSEIAGVDVPFEYTVDSNAVTVTDGVMKATAEGTANVTVSFGDYSQTVTVTVAEKENVVFNPASAGASAQVGYSTVQNTQTFFPANGTLADETYSGAYMRTQPKNTGWFNVILTPKYEISAYDNYDFITAWLYIESTTDAPVNALFFNDTSLSQALTPNAWVQVKIARSRFMEKVTANYFCSINYGTATAINIGEIVGDNYAETTNLVFEPTTADLTKVSTNKSLEKAPITFTQASANTDTTYGGAYVNMTPSETGWTPLTLKPIFNDANGYQAYDFITAWLYIVSKTNDAVTVLFSDDANLTRKITPNEWVQVKIARSRFMENVTAKYFCSINYNSTVTGINIGEIVAGNYAETTDLMFEPATADATKISTNKTSTIAFTQASENADTTYGGAYVRVAPQSLTTNSHTWVNTTLTPIKDASFYSAGAQIKVWIYVETGTATEVSPLFWNVSHTLTSNQWTEVYIPMADFVANSTKPFFGTNFRNNGTWGVTAIRIGEIVVEGVEKTIFNPANENAVSQVAYGVNNDVFANAEKVFVTAEENDDTTYDGAYLRAVPTNYTATGNVIINPEFGTNAYVGYDTMTVWVYVESDNATVKLSLLDDTVEAQTVATNQWVQIELSVEDYMNNFTNGTYKYLCAVSFKDNNATAIRIGEITAVKNA